MSLPDMTPLQALTVNVLFEGELPSRQIQDELDFRGVKMQMPLVYRMLGRLELAEYVRGRYRQYQTPDGRTIRERHYRVTESGLKEWYRTVSFYKSMRPPPDHFELADHIEYEEQDEDDEEGDYAD